MRPRAGWMIPILSLPVEAPLNPLPPALAFLPLLPRAPCADLARELDHTVREAWEGLWRGSPPLKGLDSPTGLV